MKKYLVVGLGVTGLSVIRYLRSQNLDVVATDSRDNPPSLDIVKKEFPNVPLHLGEIVIPDDISDVIASPGITLDTYLPMYGDIELFARVASKPIIAITGSNGKSTVTTLLGDMARASGLNPGVGGNIGVAALDLLTEDYDCYILELSSFQLETTTSLKPLVATILNITPDHMDRYASIPDYQSAKMKIYQGAKYAVTNTADKLTHVDLKGKSFGIDTGDYKVMAGNLTKDSNRLMPVADMAILGKHNVENALASLAIGELAGFKMDAMLDTLRKFKGLEHRCELICRHNDVLWINDSKGTNTGATVAALEGLHDSISGKWVAILGGEGKNADFSPLLAPLQEYCSAAILIGNEKQNLLSLLSDKLPCFLAENLAEVVGKASQLALPGDGVLFSPACASFDMFDNYMHRGRAFKQHAQEFIST